MQFLSSEYLLSDTSSHLKTIQTIGNNHLVTNYLYIKVIQQKPDNLTVSTVFCDMTFFFILFPL